MDEPARLRIGASKPCLPPHRHARGTREAETGCRASKAVGLLSLLAGLAALAFVLSRVV